MNKTLEAGNLRNYKIKMAQQVKARMSNTVLGNGPCRPKEQTFMSFVLDNAIMDDETLSDFCSLLEE
jgi:anthranilate/para-aminobenzoate synthase component II